MNEQVRKRGIWIGLGALAIVFLCVMLSAMGLVAIILGQQAPVVVQPPAGDS